MDTRCRGSDVGSSNGKTRVYIAEDDHRLLPFLFVVFVLQHFYASESK